MVGATPMFVAGTLSSGLALGLLMDLLAGNCSGRSGGKALQAPGEKRTVAGLDADRLDTLADAYRIARKEGRALGEAAEEELVDALAAVLEDDRPSSSRMKRRGAKRRD